MSAFVRNTWYIAAWSHEIAGKPLHRKICDDHVALYRTAMGAVKAIGAVCPHRGANLAEGDVIGESLRCPYHGWKFGGDGQCKDIPSQPDSLAIQKNACVPAYPIREQQGIVWIWPGRQGMPDKEPPAYDLLDQPDKYGVVFSQPATLRAHFINVVENAFDESHLCFIHQRTIGMKTPLVPRQIISKDADGQGVTARWDPETPWGHDVFAFKGDFQPKRNWVDQITSLALFASGRKFPDWRKRRWKFRMGGVVTYHEFTEEGEPTMLVFGGATPVDAENTMFLTAFASLAVKSWIGKLAMSRFGPMLNEEDRTGTEGLLAKADALKHPVSVIADRPAVAFRRLYSDALCAEGGDAHGAIDAVKPKLTEVA